MKKLLIQAVGVFAIALAVPSFAHACGFYDLSIQKTGPATVVPGARITYTLEVAELVSGGNSAQQVVITDSIPAGLIFDPSATRFEYFSLFNRTPYLSQYPELWHPDTIAQFGRPNCAQEGAQVVCRLPMLDNNEGIDKARISLTFTAPLSLACGSTFQNTASIRARETVGQEGDNNVGNNASVVSTLVSCPATPTPTATATPAPKPQCSDSADNDNDGVEDADDPGCHTDGDPTDGDDTYNPDDDDERNGQCSDGIDNEGDGFIDRKDPDCHTDGDPNDGDNTFNGNFDEDTNNRPVIKSVVVQAPQAVPVTARTGASSVGILMAAAGAAISFLTKKYWN